MISFFFMIAWWIHLGQSGVHVQESQVSIGNQWDNDPFRVFQSEQPAGLRRRRVVHPEWESTLAKHSTASPHLTFSFLPTSTSYSNGRRSQGSASLFVHWMSVFVALQALLFLTCIWWKSCSMNKKHAAQNSSGGLITSHQLDPWSAHFTS